MFVNMIGFVVFFCILEMYMKNNFIGGWFDYGWGLKLCKGV